MEHPSLGDSRAKLCRARKHLGSLERSIEEHRKSRPYTTGIEGNVDTGQYVVTLRPTEVPKQIGLLIGDVIANLRSALDYLIYALAWLDSGHPQRGTQFPITDDAEKFKSAKQRWLAGLSQEHIAAIELLQPYNTAEWLARLRDLSNADKHMHLSLVQPDTIGDIHTRDSANDGADPLFGSPGALYVEVDFRVALYEAFPGGATVIWTLQVLESQVAELIKAFEPGFERG